MVLDFRRRRKALLSGLCALMQLGSVSAVDLDPASPDSIRAATKQIAAEMMGYYTGDQYGQTPGYLPGNGQEGGYYWWVGGAMFGTMVNYWYTTGDSTWNAATTQAIAFQSDPLSGGFFDSTNISLQLGNDDQAFWALAAMMAAEYNFPDPPDEYPSWLTMAQGVFNQQVQRWDAQTCEGGIRWQVSPLNKGYEYKNSISNGCFFNLAARLGKYTGNNTYIEQAIRFWDWSVKLELIKADYSIIDGIVVDTCTDKDHTDRWSYNVGVYMLGAAVLWNVTQSNPEYASQADTWAAHTTGLVNAAQVFFKADPSGQNVLTEVICEPYDTCLVDQTTFKAYLARWMRVTAQVAPFTAANITGMLQPSVGAAATSCSGPPSKSPSGVQCGQQWYLNEFDGRTGIGMQMNALEVLQTLIDTPGPLDHTRGSSKSDPTAGSAPVGVVGGNYSDNVIDISTGDRVGAGFITAALASLTLSGAWWLLKE